MTGSPRRGRLPAVALAVAVSMLVAASCSTASSADPPPAGSGPESEAPPTTATAAADPEAPPTTATAAADPEAAPTTEAAPAGTAGARAVVTHVVDGDTVEVAIGGATESVRLIGIDSPEKTGGLRPAECYGDEASARARQLLPRGSEVRLLRDVEARDRYDRLLAYVFRADGLFVNLDLVEDGYAAAFPYEPNTSFSDELAQAEAGARRLGLGLWGACGSPDRAL